MNGISTKYFIEGDRVVLAKAGNEERAFWYDGDGNAAAFVIYDSAGMHPYYYFRSGQGDIIGLFDGNGNIVARYSYDSWGNLLKITDGSGNDKTNDTAFVGYKNPLRYRSYYYDSETKLYYLQSRYYNPEWGRFLNADGIIGANGDLTSNNLFAYCSNNPTNLIDVTGMKVHALSLNFSISFFICFSYSISYVWDDEGNAAIQETTGLGGSLLPDAQASVSYSCYGGINSLSELEGESNDISLGIAHYNGDIIVGKENYQSGYSLGAGISAMPFNVSTADTITKTKTHVTQNHRSVKTGRCNHQFSKPHYAADLPPHMVEIRCVHCGYRNCYYATAEDYARMKS